MKFVKVNYHLNKKFFVEEIAYKEMVIKTLENIKEKIKIKKLDIVCYERKNSFAIFLEIEKDLKNGYFKIINKIQKELEEKSHLLINTKPVNIEIKMTNSGGE